MCSRFNCKGDDGIDAETVETVDQENPLWSHAIDVSA